MKKMFKKSCALLTTVALTLSCITFVPFAVSADGSDSTASAERDINISHIEFVSGKTDSNADTVKARAFVRDYSGNTGKVSLLCATYDADNNLVGAGVKTGMNALLSTDAYETAGGTTTKAYVWDATTLAPVTDVATRGAEIIPTITFDGKSFKEYTGQDFDKDKYEYTVDLSESAYGNYTTLPQVRVSLNNLCGYYTTDNDKSTMKTTIKVYSGDRETEEKTLASGDSAITNTVPQEYYTQKTTTYVINYTIEGSTSYDGEIRTKGNDWKEFISDLQNDYENANPTAIEFPFETATGSFFSDRDPWNANSKFRTGALMHYPDALELDGTVLIQQRLGWLNDNSQLSADYNDKTKSATDSNTGSTVTYTPSELSSYNFYNFTVNDAAEVIVMTNGDHKTIGEDWIKTTATRDDSVSIMNRIDTLATYDHTFMYTKTFKAGEKVQITMPRNGVTMAVFVKRLSGEIVTEASGTPYAGDLKWTQYTADEETSISKTATVGTGFSVNPAGYTDTNTAPYGSQLFADRSVPQNGGVDGYTNDIRAISDDYKFLLGSDWVMTTLAQSGNRPANGYEASFKLYKDANVYLFTNTIDADKAAENGWFVRSGSSFMTARSNNKVEMNYVLCKTFKNVNTTNGTDVVFDKDMLSVGENVSFAVLDYKMNAIPEKPKAGDVKIMNDETTVTKYRPAIRSGFSIKSDAGRGSIIFGDRELDQGTNYPNEWMELHSDYDFLLGKDYINTTGADYRVTVGNEYSFKLYTNATVYIFADGINKDKATANGWVVRDGATFMRGERDGNTSEYMNYVLAKRFTDVDTNYGTEVKLDKDMLVGKSGVNFTVIDYTNHAVPRSAVETIDWTYNGTTAASYAATQEGFKVNTQGMSETDTGAGTYGSKNFPDRTVPTNADIGYTNDVRTLSSEYSFLLGQPYVYTTLATSEQRPSYGYEASFTLYKDATVYIFSNSADKTAAAQNGWRVREGSDAFMQIRLNTNVNAKYVLTKVYKNVDSINGVKVVVNKEMLSGLSSNNSIGVIDVTNHDVPGLSGISDLTFTQYTDAAPEGTVASITDSDTSKKATTSTNFHVKPAQVGGEEETYGSKVYTNRNQPKNTSGYTNEVVSIDERFNYLLGCDYVMSCLGDRSQRADKGYETSFTLYKDATVYMFSNRYVDGEAEKAGWTLLKSNTPLLNFQRDSADSMSYVFVKKYTNVDYNFGTKVVLDRAMINSDGTNITVVDYANTEVPTV